MLDKSKITDIELDGVYSFDYPDFCDAYILNADYLGVPMTDEQLEEINSDREFVNECVHDQCFNS